MQIQVSLFATLRQIAGWKERTVELPDGVTLGILLEKLTEKYPDLNLTERTLYAAVNQEYARPDTPLRDGDEVALFPPVSGGGQNRGYFQSGRDREEVEAMNEPKLFEITDQPLSLDDVAARVSQPNCGAIATFAGVVRGETAVDDDVRDTDFLEYEAYVSMAEKTMAQIGAEIRAKWPAVERVSILHRIGRCDVGEPSVVIAVATPHRGDGCFEACRYAIERLKAIVPIWKQENWVDGQVWVEGPRQPDLALDR